MQDATWSLVVANDDEVQPFKSDFLRSPAAENKLIPALQSALIFPGVLSFRGRFHEASCQRGGMRRLRSCFASTAPGRPGQPSDPTTWVCLQWLDGGRTNAGESLRDRAGRKALLSAPGSTAPG